MGGFYANITLRTRRIEDALAWLKASGLPAAVAFDGEHIVLADTRLDEQDEAWLTHATVLLGSVTNCFGLGALVHDDSILIMNITDGRNRVHRYHSCPAYFGDEGSSCPTGGEATLFAEAFNPTAAIPDLDRILNACDADGSDASYPYAFESDRHGDVCATLGLPRWSKFFTYARLKDSPPEGFDPGWLVHYGAF